MRHHQPMHHIYNEQEMLRRLRGRAGFASFGALRHFKKLLAERERELLVEARARGFSWHVIGGMLGVSGQAAHQRWKRLTAVVDEE